MRLRRAVTTASALLVALAVLGPATANAAPTVEAGGGVISARATSTQGVFVAQLTAVVVPAGPGAVTVAWNCAGQGVSDTVATSIADCQVNGATSSPATFPAGETLTGCVSVTFTQLDASTRTLSACGNLTTVGA